jgi:CBS domain-containing protein
MTTKSVLVKDYMARTLVTFKPETDVLDAVHVLVKHRIAGAPVVDDEGNLLGMLSEYDCMKVALDAGYHGTWGGPVREFMSDGVDTVDADMSIVDLAQVFIIKKFCSSIYHQKVPPLSGHAGNAARWPDQSTGRSAGTRIPRQRLIRQFGSVGRQAS